MIEGIVIAAVVAVLIIVIYQKYWKKKEGFNLVGNANAYYEQHSRCMRDCSLSDKRKGSTHHKWACSKYCDIVIDKAVRGEGEPHFEPTPHEMCSTLYQGDNNRVANCECLAEVEGWCQQECRFSHEDDCMERCQVTKEANCKSGNNWVRLEE